MTEPRRTVDQPQNTGATGEETPRAEARLQDLEPKGEEQAKGGAVILIDFWGSL